MRGLIASLSRLGKGAAAARISAFFLSIAIFIEGAIEYVLWPFRLLLRAAGNEEHPPPLFGGRVFAAIGGLLCGKETAARGLDHVAEYYHRLGDAARAIATAEQALKTSPTAAREAAVLHCMIAAADDNADAFAATARAFGERLKADVGAVAPASRQAGGPPSRPLHVGVMGDFFCGQIAGQSLRRQFDLHDPALVTCVIYDSGPESCPALYPRCAYHAVADLDDDALARRIREDAIDILIETSGPIRPRNRLGVLARRPAPVQVNWYNLPATFGLDTVDYAICDAVSVPDDQEPRLCEAPLRLPCGATGSWRIGDAPAPAPAPAEANGIFTFGCFGDAFKMNTRVIDAWADILHAVPASRLYLKNGALGRPMGRLLFARAFARRGIAPARLRLEGFSAYDDMRALYSAVDLALDTFPYSNGSTTINALWQGVPALTRPGPDWRGRTTASILASAGLNDFIRTSTADYVATAVEYARNPAPLTALRAGMRARLMEKSAYFRLETYTRDFERTLAETWHRGEKPVTSRGISLHSGRAHAD